MPIADSIANPHRRAKQNKQQIFDINCKNTIIKSRGHSYQFAHLLTQEQQMQELSEIRTRKHSYRKECK